MTNGDAKKRRVGDDADTKNPLTKKLREEAVAELVDELRVAMDDHNGAINACATAEMELHETAFHEANVRRTLSRIHDKLRLFLRMFPFDVVDWGVVDIAKVILHTLEKDSTGYTTARVAEGDLDLFAVYFGTC
jgi:hypothetical protein